ncbi:acyclic terpene utilization AtuA family protein, partial [Neobacillus niacini]|uniref:acyclic terpene utilization AtuA family protein n=1 Tax=Neobacillus niacini TaxID=86668 RepID=UPI00300186A0
GSEKQMKNILRIGSGSAYAEDDLIPAIDLAEKGDLDYICFDSLAERTLALAQQRKSSNPHLGYDLRLEELVKTFAPYVGKGKLKVIGNMGAANPIAAVEKAMEICKEMGITDVRFAAITGDDISDKIESLNPILWETGERLSQLDGKVVCANAYTGVEGIVEALEKGANFIIGGRLADPSLYVAPMIHEFGWSLDDWGKIGKGTLIAHILECGTHVTGGNFADPPYRMVPDLDNLGLPIGEIDPSGNAIITKLDSTGGMVSEGTVKTQMVYEVHDPARYVTPDVTCNMRYAEVKEESKNRISVTGASGEKHPENLKVMVGVSEGYIGEGEVSFAGPGASERAKLSREILRKRINRRYGDQLEELRIDIIGLDSIHANASTLPTEELHDARVRVAARTKDKKIAEAIGKEVEWQFFGPSGGGGFRKNIREVLTMYSTLVPRSEFKYDVQLKEV